MRNYIKTFIILVLFYLILPLNCYCTDGNQLVVDVLISNNDTVFRSSFLYDNQGNKVLETRYFQNNADWTRLSQTEWFYNAGKCIRQADRIRQNGNWINKHLIEYLFDNNVITSEIYSIYSNGDSTHYKKINYQYNIGKLYSKSEYLKSNGVWSLSQVNSFDYLPDGKTDTIHTDIYLAGQLSKQVKLNYKYYSSGSVDTLIVQEKQLNSPWTNQLLSKWYYTIGTNQPKVQWNKEWMTDISQWNNTQKTEYEYNDGGQLLSEIYLRWESMFWTNVLRYDYQYDANANIIQRKLSIPLYRKWREAISVDYSSYINNKVQLIESKFDYWGGDEGELTCSVIPFMVNNDLEIRKANRIEFVNLPYIETNVPNSNLSSSSVLVYPNPSEGIFYLNTQKTLQSWNLYDLSGQLLKSNNHNFGSNMIDLSDFPKGIYLLKVITKEGQINQKIVKN